MRKNSNLLPKMIRGTICSQRVRCGKPNCKCAGGELHGPYYYHFERVAGVLKKRYVNPKELEQIRRLCSSRQATEKERRAIAQANQRHWSKLSKELRVSEKLISERRELRYA